MRAQDKINARIHSLAYSFNFPHTAYLVTNYHLRRKRPQRNHYSLRLGISAEDIAKAYIHLWLPSICRGYFAAFIYNSDTPVHSS